MRSELNSNQENGSWITNTLSGGEGVTSLAFSDLREFSNITLERLEPGYAQELMQYEGNRFVLIATKPFSDAPRNVIFIIK